VIELTVVNKGHQNGWLLCELREGSKLVAKICAPACLARAMTQALDNNFSGKSLIQLKDSESSSLFSRQKQNK
jgi:hypothetical protein